MFKQRTCAGQSRLAFEQLEPRALLAGGSASIRAPIFDSSPVVVSADPTLPHLIRQIVVADFDGDGLNDIALIAGAPFENAPNGNDTRLWFLRGIGQGPLGGVGLETFAAPVITAMAGEVDAIAPGRFSTTPRGQSDLAILGRFDDASGQGTVMRVLRFKPAASALRVVARERIALPPYRQSMAVGNVTGAPNGTPAATDEIVVQVRSTNPGAANAPVQLFIGIYGIADAQAGSAGGGANADRFVLKAIVKQGTYEHNIGLGFGDISLTDLDGDHVQEVLFSPGIATRAWFHASPAGPERRITLAPAAATAGPTRFIYADMDGDASADRVSISTTFGSTTAAVTLERGRGDGSFDPGVALPGLRVPGSGTGQYPTIVPIGPTGAADIDGDSLTDIFVMWRRTDVFHQDETDAISTLTTYFSNTLTPAAVLNTGTAWLSTLGDITGDSQPDLIQATSNGTLIARLNYI